MNDLILTSKVLAAFCLSLIEEEKSRATQEKYLHIAEAFRTFADSRPVTKELVIAYKSHLIASYSPKTVNIYLAGVNRLLKFLGLRDCTVKSLSIQRQVFLSEERELTKGEYLRLLEKAEPTLRLIMETICSTGIRVSELSYFTKEAVEQGSVPIRLKGKCRDVLLSGKLRKKLLRYCAQKGIASGAIFRSGKGTPMDRSVIWAKMKRLCAHAGVQATKVFPHNLRKLFARCYYRLDRDLARLADILGHSSIETTRIYIMSTRLEHRKQIELLNLVI